MNINAAIRALPAYLAGIAERSGVTLAIGGSVASTDGKTVRVPALPVPRGTLTSDQIRYLGELRTLTVGHVAHEACHINHSDFRSRSYVESSLGLTYSPVLAGFVNALEDIRIEAAMAKTWRGLASIRSETIRIGVAHGRFQSDPDPMSPAQRLQFYLHWALRCHYLGNTGIADIVERFRLAAEAEFGGTFVRMVESIAEEVRLAGSTDEVWRLSARLVSALEAQANQPPPQDPDTLGEEAEDSPEPGSDQTGAGEDDAPDEANGAQSPDQGDSDSSDDSSDDGDQDSSDQNPADGSSETEPAEGGNPSGDGGEGHAGALEKSTDPSIDSADDAPTSSQIAAAQSALSANDDEVMNHQDHDLQSLLEEQCHESVAQSHDLTTAGGSQYLCVESRPERRDMQRMQRLSQVATAVAGRLTRLLSAQARRECRISDRGRGLSGRHLANLRVDGRVFTKKARTTYPNTAVSILVDRSTSMSDNGRWTLALDASLAIGAAIETIPGASVSICAFPQIVPLVKHGEGVRREAPRFTVHPTGTTPMGDALWWVGGQLLMQPHQRKILLTITDGEPNCVSAVESAVSALGSVGIECLALAIGDVEACRSLFKRAAQVDSPEDLSQAMVDLLLPSLQAIAA